MPVKKWTRFFLILISWGMILSPLPLCAEEWQSARVVLHVHSKTSGEKTSFEEIGYHADKKGVDGVILTDYFQQKVSYGLTPFPQIFKWSVQNPSIKTFGTEKYYSEIREEDVRFQNVVLMPGAEVTPFYWWSGSLWKGDLTVHDVQKNLLVFGLQSTDLEKLPTLENGGMNQDAYHRKSGEKAYQAVIDYVNQHQGFSVWSTPDEAFGATFTKGAVHFKTEPYDESLVSTTDYSGVAVYPEGNTRTGIPGGNWDRILSAYARGKRTKPVWAFAESVIHQRSLNYQLDDWDNVVLIHHKTEEEILDGFRRGRFYIRENKKSYLTLEKFRVTDIQHGVSADMGEEMMLFGYPNIEVKLTLPSEYAEHKIILQIIRQGVVVHEETSEGGMLDMNWQDPEEILEVEKTFYRIQAITRPQNIASLISNPIFVTKTHDGAVSN